MIPDKVSGSTPAKTITDDVAAMPKCVLTHDYFHWHGDLPPRHPWARTVYIASSPDWTDPTANPFACLIHEGERQALFLMFNAGNAAINFGLPPPPPGTRWHLAVDTSRIAPQDMFTAGEEAPVEDAHTYHLSSRSSAILLLRHQ